MRRLVTAAALLAACRGEPVRQAARPSAAIEVAVDRRVELLSILFRLVSAGGYTASDPTLMYGLAVDYHFGHFRDHPAVAATQKLAEAGIGYDGPMSLAVHLDDQLRLLPGRAALDPRWQKVALDEYLEDVRGFAAASHAQEFFARHAQYYRKVEARFRDFLARERPVAWFDRFFGPRRGVRYLLAPGLLTGPASYGPHVDLGGGRALHYSIVSLEDIDAGGLPRPSEFTAELLVHEMAHSYVNPIVDRHMAALEPAFTRIFPLVERDMREQAYGTWRIVAYESLVRAVTLRYVRERHGNAAADRLAREDESKSFYWTAELAAELGARLDVPRVVRFFDQLAARYAHGIPVLPFRGPINAVFKREPALVDAGPGASPALVAYLAEVKKQIYPSADTLPGSGELAVRAQVLYGSPATSPLVAAVIRDSGWLVEEAGISVAGRRFDGAGLVLIACRPHPRDPTLPLLVYSAARDDDIVNANAVFHGPDDWVVARHGADGRFTIVAHGDFERGRDGRWRLAGPAPR